MKNTAIVFSCLLFFGLAQANDGAFYSQGGTLIPLQISDISLQKEKLVFKLIKRGDMQISVDFQFHNPGPAKTLTVGFVTPPADGDLNGRDARHPQISNFSVRHNGKELPFQIQQLKESSFQISENKSAGTDFVYHFEVDFQPGLNRIQHRYHFQGGLSVETTQDYFYQITTGKRWANAQIDDFELELHLDQGIFYLPNSFYSDQRPINWQLIGKGSFSPVVHDFFGDDSNRIRIAHLQQGYFRFSSKNFKPDRDISIGEFQWALWAHLWCKTKKPCVDWEKENLNELRMFLNVQPDKVNQKYLAELDKRQLRILRNYFYALQGYSFKSADLKAFFSRFFWYRPDPKLKASDIRFSPGQKKLIGLIQSLEKRWR